MVNQIVWCDIPVTDLDRAVAFYTAVLGAELKIQTYEGNTYAVLPGADGVSACLMVSDDPAPAIHGPLIYLNVQGRHDEAEAQVVPSGGRLIQRKHSIGPYGLRSIIVDSEGNHLALHSR